MSVVLSEHLPLLASAPNGIQKLRGLILELAVRGKLVPQDPNDDEGSWKRGIFSDFFSLEYGDNLPAPKRTGSGEYPVYGSNGVVGTHNECRVKAPCIVVGRKGSAGALNLCHETGCWVTDVAYYCIPPRGVDLDFAFALFHTLGLDNLGKGIKPGLSRNEAYSLPVEIPPLAEQHRIVAKADELMALCDRLEAEQADAASAHARLVDTLLGTLAQSTDAADLAANWQRLAKHFDTLFTTEASMDAVKQTVLQLAVMGKLGPQDPNDEPASELLKRIQKGRRIKRKCSVVDTDNLGSPLPEVPQGWRWTVVDQVAADHENSISDGPFGANLKTEHYISEPGYRVIRLQNIGYGDFRGEHHAYVTQERFLSLQKHHVYAGDLVVAGLVDDRVRCCELPKTIGHALVKADCYRFSVHPEVCSTFALYYLNSPLFSDFAATQHHGMTLTRIGLGNFRQLPFPLPPAAEQHRIITKVDELMALCDRLKTDLATARQRQQQLATGLIATALAA